MLDLTMESPLMPTYGLSVTEKSSQTTHTLVLPGLFEAGERERVGDREELALGEAVCGCERLFHSNKNKFHASKKVPTPTTRMLPLDVSVMTKVSWISKL